MNFENFKKFIEKEHIRLLKSFPCDRMDRETFARAVKLTEEVGELNEAILKDSAMQRSEKDRKLAKKNLEDEFADVIITTFLLAERMKVDIGDALENKVRKIKRRKY